MANTTYTEALAQTLKNEGGVDASGIGGQGVSNLGVTQTAFDAYTTKRKLPKRDVKTISPQEAEKLYYEDYFIAPGIDQLPGVAAKQVFDFGVHSSPKTAIIHLQKVVGAKADGILGPKTVVAVNKYIEENGEDALQNDILDERAAFLQKIADKNPKEYGKVIKGWLNRVQAMRPKEKK
jgi:lysozyme family protein